MATTTLIVDFLIIGVSSMIWIFPVLICFLGTDWLHSSLDIGTGLLPIIIGMIYILGISMSRMTDDFTDRLNDKLRDEVFGKNADPSYHNQLNLIISKSESAMEYLSYRRSIIRISRASGIGLMLGTIAWLIIACFRSDIVDKSLSVVIASFSGLLGFYLLRSWYTVLRGYFRGIQDLYDYLKE